MTNILYSSINVVFSLISTFLKIILAPIDVLIEKQLPDISIMLDKISDFLDLCVSSIGWIIDLFGIPSGVILLIISYFTLKYGILVISIPMKIIIRWVKSLK